MAEYQAIYNAVRSRIHGCDVGGAVERAAREAFDISYALDAVRQELICAAQEAQRPSVLFRPRLTVDGSQWCALYGESLMNGCAGFGDTPAAAMGAFDDAWRKAQPPEASEPKAAG